MWDPRGLARTNLQPLVLQVTRRNSFAQWMSNVRIWNNNAFRSKFDVEFNIPFSVLGPHRLPNIVHSTSPPPPSSLGLQAIVTAIGRTTLQVGREKKLQL
jgi:hypothetical protein